MYREQIVLVTDANIQTFVDIKNKNEKILPIKLAFQYLRSKGTVHTQQDVANKLSVSKENISRLMNGNESCHTPSYSHK